MRKNKTSALVNNFQVRFAFQYENNPTVLTAALRTKRTYPLLSVLVLDSDAVIGGNVANETLSKVVHDCHLDTPVLVHTGSLFVNQHGHDAHPVHVIRNRLCRLDPVVEPSCSLRALLLVYGLIIAKKKEDDDVGVSKKASEWFSIFGFRFSNDATCKIF